MEQPILLGIGGNLNSHAGPPITTIERVIDDFEDHSIHVVGRSALYSTPCFPAGAGPDYVNAAVEVETDLTPTQLLSALHELEAKYGRERQARWAGRSLDIDLLAYGDLIAPDKETLRRWIDLDLKNQKIESPGQLILPHPRIQDRGFVLIPLADIAPDWRHPLLGKTVLELLAELSPAGRAEICQILP
ncbi:MAG: 2-amino-4-hydroxy-6-hydroxymethyldihydropteridine diphosphokinase [Paracoccaceae bacterium]|nr:2-amino-4-hydroxy-6-hydroxymethyldihydropteridine diphosphokinase [Paracoccaceae bacterium]